MRLLKISLHINVHLIDRYFEAQEESLTINYKKKQKHLHRKMKKELVHHHNAILFNLPLTKTIYVELDMSVKWRSV